ncbi:MAG: EAL domain-containing protein [Polyangiaceae bacterium]
MPSPLTGVGKLYLWPADWSDAPSLILQLDAAEARYEVLELARCMTVAVDDGCIVSLLDRLRHSHSDVQLETTKVLLMHGQTAPGLMDIPRAESLKSYIAQARARWLMELLNQDRLDTHFQPIVDAQDTTRVHAHEALMRGHDGEGGMIPPFRMITAARDARLMGVLDTLSISRAFRAANERSLSTRIFLNVTPSTITRESFTAEKISRECRAQGVEPQRVVLELIESESISDMSATVERLDAFRAAGFSVALDDVGAGFSNLNLLHQLRPDVVKLDMDLTRDIHEDPYKAVVATKILELAAHLEIDTVVEGVEAIEELEWFRERGVTYAQGYLIAKPCAEPLTRGPRL